MANEFPSAPPKKTGFPIWIPIAIAVALVLFIILAMASFLALPFLMQLSGKGAGNAPPIFAAADWGERKLEEVTLEAPCEFGPGPNVLSQLPIEVQEAVQYMDVYQSKDLPESFIIMVSRIKYADVVEVDLDGAMHGAVVEAGRAVGDLNPQYSSKPTQVSGMEGRYGSYETKFGKTHFRLQSIVAGGGPYMWQIQVIFEHQKSAIDASRILKSVQIEQ